MIGRKVGFTRWYDTVPELSQAVRTMEKMPVKHQQLIASVIISYAPMAEVAEKTDQGLKKVGGEKLMGLMKSKNKKRWYDQDPTVHQAFNYLFVMNEKMRYEIALKMIIAMSALEKAAADPKFANKDPAVVKAIFDSHLMELMDKTNFDEPGKEKKPALTVNSANAIDTGEMKLVRLKME